MARLVGAAHLRCCGGFGFLDQGHDVLHLPQPRRQARRHRRGAAKRFVHPHEVVERAVQRDRVAVVLDLLAECVCQTGEPAHVHPHREVLPLDVGRADMRRVGTALDAAHVHTGASAGAVAAQRADRLAVVLDEHGVVDVRAERAFNGF